MINFDPPTPLTPDGIQQAVNTMILDTTNSVSKTESSLNSLVDTATDNCDIFGSMGSIMKSVSDSAQEKISGITSSIQSSIADVMKSVSDAISKMKTIIADLKKMMTTIVAKLQTLGMTVMNRVVEIMKKLSSQITGIFSGIDGVMSSISDMMADIMTKFSKSLRKMFSVKCSSVKGALNSMAPENMGKELRDSIELSTMNKSDVVVKTMESTKTSLTVAANSLTSGVESMMMKKANSNILGLDGTLNQLRNI